MKTLQALGTTLRECEQDSLYKIGYFKDVKAAAERVLFEMVDHKESGRLSLTMARISVALQQRSWAAFNKEIGRALVSLQVVVEVVELLEKKAEPVAEKPLPKYKSLLDMLLDVCDDKVTVHALDSETRYKCVALPKESMQQMYKLAYSAITCLSDDPSIYKVRWIEGGESLIKVEVV